jgi:hypothetical protein
VVSARRQALLLLSGCGSGSWRLAAAAALTLGGAAAGWRQPSAPDYLQLAIAQDALRRTGAAFMAAPPGRLDLRSWLTALLSLGLHHLAGAAGLVALTVLLGSAFGFLLAISGWRANAHPLALALGGGAALAALSQLPATSSTYWLALLGAVALLLLAEVRRGRRWALAGLVGLCLIWANLESAAVLVPPALLLISAADRFAPRPKDGRLPWLLAPAAALAVMVNPRGPGIYSALSLSLGQGGEHPLLALWSSPNFHPWSMRVVELAALLLLATYLLAGRRLAPGDALVGLVAASSSLLWAFYLPLLVAVVGVQVPALLRAPPPPERSGAPSRAALALCLPLLAALGLGVSAVRLGDRASGMAPSASAVDFLRGAGGVWYSTPELGDYLAADFPAGRRLMCVTDQMAAGETRMVDCHRLAQLAAGTLALLSSAGVRLAVLPPANPGVAFLHAEGWRTRYRDQLIVVLTPPPSGL